MVQVPRSERTPRWSPRQESNLHFSLRRAAFYPLNYEEARVLDTHRGGACIALKLFQCQHLPGLPGHPAMHCVSRHSKRSRVDVARVSAVEFAHGLLEPIEGEGKHALGHQLRDQIDALSVTPNPLGFGVDPDGFGERLGQP